MTRRDPSDERSGETATLLVTCPDRTGLVAALAQTLYGHGANILDADQHTDPVAGQFFQRIRFETAGLHTDRLTLERARTPVERVAASVHRRFADTDEEEYLDDPNLDPDMRKLELSDAARSDLLVFLREALADAVRRAVAEGPQ